MKHYNFFLVIFFTLFSSTVVTAWNVISVEPKDAQGFLILKGDIPSVEYWKLNIYQREYNPNRSDLVEQITIVDKNYYRIPNKYLVNYSTKEYYYNIEGWSRSSVIAQDTGVLMLPYYPTVYIPEHRFACNGPTYAWAIQQYRHPSGGMWNYCLESHTDVMDGIYHIPFYEYKTYYPFVDQVEIPTNQELRDYYNLQLPLYKESFVYDYENYSAPKTFKIDIGEGGTYKSYDGTLLSPPIIAVQKVKGPWGNGVVLRADSIIEDWNNFEMQGIINRFNQYSNITTDYPELPLLVCPSNNFQIDDYEPDYSGFDTTFCSDVFLNMGEQQFVDIFSDYIDCLNDLYSFSSGLSSISFNKWNSGACVRDTIFYDDDFTQNGKGEVEDLQYSLRPGLYSINYTNTDGRIAVAFFELNAVYTLTVPMSSFLDINIYPVPLQDDTFKMDLSASASFEVLYEIFDLQSVRYHRESFNLAKDSNGTFNIISDSSLPNGILINKFTFPDGSYRTIQTVK